MLADGRRARIDVLAVDTDADLALLQIEATGPFAFIPVPAEVPTRRPPLKAVTHDGIGDAEYLEEVFDEDTGDAIAFSTGLGPGASGDAIVDAGGRLIGVIRGGVVGDEVQTIAVPVVRLVRFLERNEDRSTRHSE